MQIRTFELEHNVLTIAFWGNFSNSSELVIAWNAKEMKDNFVKKFDPILEPHLKAPFFVEGALTWKMTENPNFKSQSGNSPTFF